MSVTEEKLFSASSPIYDGDDENYKYVQSANVLFKFMGELAYLKEALELKAILPRYYEEKIEYLNIDNLSEIAIPMSCFCDIHLNKINHHISKYGKYGIGLNKKWGVESGIQPIQYLNTKSPLVKSLSEILHIAFSQGKSSQNDINKLYKKHILYQLFYVKPLKGIMPISNQKTAYRNFHDEKEWRFVPNFDEVNTDLRPIIKAPYINGKSLSNYSEAIKENEGLWLKFNYTDIKYMIVESDSEREELINFILSELETTQDEKYILLSKIIVTKELEEDI